MRLKEHQAVIARNEAFRVDPRQLKIDQGFNVRDLDAQIAREHLDELKASIKAEGVQCPLEIRIQGEDLFITSGHRRHKVVMELIAEGVDIESVPAIAEPKTIDEAERTARLITLNSGEPLSSLEKAEVVRRLLAYGWSRGKIATRFGFKTEQSVANYELLLAAPIELKTAVREGEISASNAINITRANPTPTQAKEALTRAREAAKKNGKTKLTNKTTNGETAPQPERPRNQNNVDKALALLHEVANNGYSATTAAAAYFALTPSQVAEILDWMTVFEDRLRDRLATATDEAA